jgi:hypothetical protein
MALVAFDYGQDWTVLDRMLFQFVARGICGCFCLTLSIWIVIQSIVRFFRKDVSADSKNDPHENADKASDWSKYPKYPGG